MHTLLPCNSETDLGTTVLFAYDKHNQLRNYDLSKNYISDEWMFFFSDYTINV